MATRRQPVRIGGRMVGGEHGGEAGSLGSQRRGGDAGGSEQVGIAGAVKGETQRDEHTCSLGMSAA